MYADRVLAAGSKRSINERLNGEFDDTFSRGRQSNPKRQRQDEDKWKHDLYDNSERPRLSNPKLGVKDLRLKLQRKSSQTERVSQATERVSQSGDLREKLSGMSRSQPVPPTTDVRKSKLTSDAKVMKRSAPTAETAELNASNPSAEKKNNQKSGSSVAALLKSLGLEKYLITFQAEEIDMTALIHMSDEDLKALGIPMGPRKKLLLALDSRVKS